MWTRAVMACYVIWGLLPLLYAMLLLIGPIIVIVANSFWSQDYLTIDRTFTLDELPKAHRFMEANRAKGKLVVVV